MSTGGESDAESGARSMSTQPSPIDDATIARLGALSPFDYDREKKSAAKEMGVIVGALDSAIKQKRKESSEVTTKGREITLYEPDLWPVTVDGAEMLSEAADHILRHMMISEADAYACVL